MVSRRLCLWEPGLKDSSLIAHAWIQAACRAAEKSDFAALMTIGQQRSTQDQVLQLQTSSIKPLSRAGWALDLFQKLWLGTESLTGIAAVLNLDGAPRISFRDERMANVLRPYGPDRQKTLQRGPLAFVSCLHILTPEDVFDQQPLLADRLVTLLFDGRIDNRLELCGTLGMTASEASTTADSLIAFRPFDRYGERAFEQIVGDFAIIVIDLQGEQLICARDQMGLRVLHYHHSANRFAAATVPEALFALGGVPRILNKDKIGDTLVKRGLNGETTYYQEINRVIPGCFVRVGSRRISKERYWYPEKIPTICLKKDADYVEEFQGRLDEAVKAMLRSREVPCATITGGLDSSSISVIAADFLAATGKKLNTFTAVPEDGFIRPDTRGNYFDERPYVLQIEKYNQNLIPHFIPPSKGPILEQIAAQIRLGGAPSGSILNGLWIMDIYSAARSAGHNVMLVGELGNLTMSYHGRGVFAELLRTGRLLRLFNEIRYSGYQWQKMLRQWTVSPFIPAAIFSKYKQWRRSNEEPWYNFSAIHPVFANKSGVISRAAREYLPFDAPPHRVNRLARINDFNCYSETADWYVRLRASFGIDTRAPAWDRRVVEFCIGIPEDQYLRNGCDRWLIRRAMKGRLPDTVLYKKKYGGQAVDWFPRLARERERIADEFRRLSTVAEVPSIIDLERVAANLQGWPDHQPSDLDPRYDFLAVAIPQALGAAYFIEDVLGRTMEDSR